MEHAFPDPWHCVPPHSVQPDLIGRNTVACWTGGKDSFLAYLKGKAVGLEVSVLATFSPPGKTFFAHPKDVLLEQAAVLGLPHVFLDVAQDGDHKAGYVEGLRSLRDERGISAVISGDMDLVGTMQGNWMRERCETAGLHMYCPLWKLDRLGCLQELLDAGVRAVLTCVKSPCFDASWLGREIDAAMLLELQRLGAEKGLDLCGENGEYHTMVLGGPGFQSYLCLRGCERVELLPPDWQRTERCWYLKVGQIDRVAPSAEAALVHFAV